MENLHKEFVKWLSSLFKYTEQEIESFLENYNSTAYIVGARGNSKSRATMIYHTLNAIPRNPAMSDEEWHTAQGQVVNGIAELFFGS